MCGRPAPALRYAPSCVVLLAGSTARYSRIAHHNLHFGGAWRSTFGELVDRGELMTDPSLLVTAPTVTDPSLAPDGASVFYVLAPVPHTRAGIDWKVVGPRYRDELIGRLETAGYVGFADGVEVEHLTTPADWARLGLAHGTPFGPAHTFRQTGPFRTRNRLLDNVVLAGGGTHPGVGIPMVLVSGRLAAERIVGADAR
jgi:phytoene desaturase